MQLKQSVLKLWPTWIKSILLVNLQIRVITTMEQMLQQLEELNLELLQEQHLVQHLVQHLELSRVHNLVREALNLISQCLILQ